MKFRNSITAAATLVCLAAFLCACGKSAPTETTAPEFPEPWSQAQVFTMPTEPSEEASGSAQTDKTSDEETALRRIEAAHAVFGLFLESRPQLDKNDSVEVEQGLMAYRVTDEHFDTMAKLHAYVSGYFSDEITQNLFNVGIFTEVEGKLYAVDVGMREPTQGELHVEVTEKTEKEEHYRLTVGTDTKKTYEFVYAKQKDGSWVFTKFENY